MFLLEKIATSVNETAKFNTVNIVILHPHTSQGSSSDSAQDIGATGQVRYPGDVAASCGYEGQGSYSTSDECDHFVSPGYLSISKDMITNLTERYIDLDHKLIN